MLVYFAVCSIAAVNYSMQMMRQVQILAKRICLLVFDKCVSNGNNIISRSTYLLSNLSTAMTSINKWEMACSELFFFLFEK